MGIIDLTQLTAVGQSCTHFTPNTNHFFSNSIETSKQNISCLTCKNWDNNRCIIHVFDDVLISLDQL